jgi:AbrB family looped-hinge helix DNA binding protein
MPHSTITKKGQTTIPGEVREALNIKPGERLEYTVEGDHATFGFIRRCGPPRARWPAIRASADLLRKSGPRRLMLQTVVRDHDEEMVCGRRSLFPRPSCADDHRSGHPRPTCRRL